MNFGFSVFPRQFRPRAVPLALFCLGSALLFLFWCLSLRQSAEFVVFSPSVHSRVEDGDEQYNTILQEVICPKGADHCFKIEDYVQSEWEESNGTNSSNNRRRSYRRRLMDVSEENVVLSVAELRPDNADAAFTPQNALRWTVQKSSLSLDYIKAIVTQMFVSGCAQLEPSDRTRRTLLIGLGGASVPNFLIKTDPSHQVVSVELEPAMEYIARKWFALEQSQRQKVFVRDGVDFIRQWTESDGRFDCLIIDACGAKMPSPGQKYPLICPFEGFVNHESIVKKIFKMLRSEGTLIINTFVIPKGDNESMVSEVRQFLLELFRHHFGGQCYYIDIFFGNKLLVCNLALPPNEPMTDKVFRDRLNKLPKWLQEELRTEFSIENEVWRKPKVEI